jgi:hypothetical protein
MILSSASTKVILNGAPGRRICHARGLRQGDPLSPLLFVLVMETLNHLLRLADLKGFLQPLHAQVRERAFFYADDVVLFSLPTQCDLVFIKLILELFANATGLRTNLDKSQISPI